MVSCHVERPLDDAVWCRFSSLQAAAPGGLGIAALIRPPDAAAGELDEELWLERAREAVARAPLGHHTHFTSPTHARPTGGETGARVRREGAWLRDQGLSPTLFCGGGWYTDRSVAEACAELGYVDCTPRTTRPRYLPPGAAWAELATPTVLLLDNASNSLLQASVRLPVIPTTHGVGDLVRALVRPGGLPPSLHAYFHDTDLVSPVRRSLILNALRLLGRLRPASDLDALAVHVRMSAPKTTWDAVARGEGAAGRA